MRETSGDLPPVDVRHLLVPVDFAGREEIVARCAVDLAERCGARLTFLHVLAPVTDDPEIVAHWGDFPERRRDAVQQRLEEWRTRFPGGREVTCVLAEGRPFEQIVAYAAGHGVDGIVMGRGGEPGLLREWLGSTSERVVRHAPCPVLVLAGEEDEEVLRHPERVLVATDFSAASRAAFPWATRMARLWGVPITLVNVQEPLALPGTLEYERYPAEIDALRQEADDRLADWRGRLFDWDLVVDTLVVEGTAHRALSRTAERSGACLVVLATHGTNGWCRALIGSTAERVVRHAPRPVLVVPSDGLSPQDDEGI